MNTYVIIVQGCKLIDGIIEICRFKICGTEIFQIEQMCTQIAKNINLMLRLEESHRNAGGRGGEVVQHVNCVRVRQGSRFCVSMTHQNPESCTENLWFEMDTFMLHWWCLLWFSLYEHGQFIGANLLPQPDVGWVIDCSLANCHKSWQSPVPLRKRPSGPCPHTPSMICCVDWLFRCLSTQQPAGSVTFSLAPADFRGLRECCVYVRQHVFLCV